MKIISKNYNDIDHRNLSEEEKEYKRKYGWDYYLIL